MWAKGFLLSGSSFHLIVMMMDEAGVLKREVFSAASRFLEARTAFLATFVRGELSIINQAAEEAQSAGLKYGKAHEKLIDYLRDPQRLLQDEAELMRFHELAGILDMQLALLIRWCSVLD